MVRIRAVMILAAASALPLAAPALAQVPLPLDTLVVGVASRTAAALPVTTRAVEVIPAEALSREPARTVADLLARVVGADLQARSPAQADVSLRGSSFEQVLVLVDGVRVSDAQTGHFDLDLAVPLGEIERIEILRGPATALYGSDAVGGVINIVTRSAGPGLSTAVEAGSFGTASISAALASAAVGGGVRVAGEYRRSDGHRSGTDYQTIVARARYDGLLADRALRADLAIAARDFGGRAFYTPPSAPFDEYEKTRALTASLAWLVAEGARFGIEPRLSARRHEDDFVLLRDDPALYRNRHTSWQVGGDLVARVKTASGVRLAVGGEAFRDLLESTSLGDRNESRGALFAEAVATPSGGITVNAGIRADGHSTFGAFVSPSASVAVRPIEWLRLRSSVGRAFRAPTWTERFYEDPANIGDPDLEAERAWEAEVGAELFPASNLRLGVSAFTRKADRLIDWARPVDGPDDAPWRTRNVVDATFRGIELEAAASWLDARWTVSATGLEVVAGSADGFISKYALRPLDRTASLAFERDLPGGISLGARALHARRAGEDAYLRADLRLALTRGPVRIHFDLQNLTAEDYLDVTGMSAPGRAAYVGLAWDR